MFHRWIEKTLPGVCQDSAVCFGFPFRCIDVAARTLGSTGPHDLKPSIVTGQPGQHEFIWLWTVEFPLFQEFIVYFATEDLLVRIPSILFFAPPNTHQQVWTKATQNMFTQAKESSRDGWWQSWDTVWFSLEHEPKQQFVEKGSRQRFQWPCRAILKSLSLIVLYIYNGLPY